MLFIVNAGFAQDATVVNGRVVSGGVSVCNVFVINKKTAIETTTDANGNFTLAAKAGDVIVVYSTEIEVREFIISSLSFKDNPYVLEVKSNAYQLDEVVINQQGITSESLGIIPRGQKKYTPAERKLYTAGDFKPIHLLQIIGGNMPLDPILNAINGRTKMLKQAVATENKEIAIAYINGLYTNNEITEQFNVPDTLVEGFLHYAVEDGKVTAACKANDELQLKFLMPGLAESFLLLQKENE